MLGGGRRLFYCSKHESNEKENTLKMVINGDFDEKIINNYKSQKFDLKKSVSGAEWKNPHSSFRYLAENIGLDRKDDNIVREIYRILIYNKRSIRDKMMSKDEEFKPFEPVTSIDIPLCAPEPPARPVFRKVSIEKQPILEKKTSSEHSKPPSSLIIRQPQSLSQVQDVDWGITPIIKSCPRCNYYGLTKIHYRIGCYTWTWVIGLAFTGICLPCSWFPCALDGTKDILHICPKCLYILGKVPRNPLNRKSVEDLYAKKPSSVKSVSEKQKSLTLISNETK